MVILRMNGPGRVPPLGPNRNGDGDPGSGRRCGEGCRCGCGDGVASSTVVLSGDVHSGEFAIKGPTVPGSSTPFGDLLSEVEVSGSADLKAFLGNGASSILGPSNATQAQPRPVGGGQLPFVPREYPECRFSGEVQVPTTEDILSGGYSTDVVCVEPYPRTWIGPFGQVRTASWRTRIKVCVHPLVRFKCSVTCECEDGSVRTHSWAEKLRLYNFCLAFWAGVGVQWHLPVVSPLLAAIGLIEKAKELSIEEIIANLSMSAALQEWGEALIGGGQSWCRLKYSLGPNGGTHPCNLPR